MLKVQLKELMTAAKLWKEDFLKSDGTNSGNFEYCLNTTIRLVLAKTRIEVYVSIYDHSRNENFVKNTRIGTVSLKEWWRLMDFLLYIEETFMNDDPQDSPENIRSTVDHEMKLLKSNSPQADHFSDVYLEAAKLHLYHMAPLTPEVETYVPFECTQIPREKIHTTPYAYFLRIVLKSLVSKDFTGWPTSVKDSSSLGVTISF